VISMVLAAVTAMIIVYLRRVQLAGLLLVPLWLWVAFATALNAIHFFGFVRPDLRPRRQSVSGDAINQIAKLGGLFFVLQVVVAVSFSADNFIVARTLGAINVPEYSIPQRMFAIVSMVSGMLVAPLWPAYGEAISRGDMKWVRGTLGYSLLIVFVSALAISGALLIASPKLIYWWVGHRIHPPFILLLGLAIWTVIDCCGGALSSFLNGASVIKFQVIVASIFGSVCLMLKIFLIRRFGIVGVPWAAIMAYSLLCIVPFAVYVPRFISRMAPSDPPSSAE